MSDETRANATVFDYLRWRGDLTLAQDGFNEVDSLILCIISYINLKKLRQLWSFDPKDAMPMGDVCRQLTEEDEQLGLSTLDYIPLMRAAAETAGSGTCRCSPLKVSTTRPSRCSLPPYPSCCRTAAYTSPIAART